MFPFAFPASAARFLHSPTRCISEFLWHKAQMRPVEMTVTVRGTFEKSTYGLCVSVRSLENAMPSPVEKGDRGAVDKDYPGIKENETNKKASFSSDTEERRFFRWIQLISHTGICIWSEAKCFRSPFPLVLRDFSALLHIAFQSFCGIKHKCDRSK